jgi:hypothetical protein
MQFFTFLFTLAHVVPILPLSSASPAPGPVPEAEPGNGWHTWRKCLSDADATLLANVWISTTVGFDPNYVAQFFADDFALYSDSVNFLFGLPVSMVSPFSSSLKLCGK